MVLAVVVVMGIDAVATAVVMMVVSVVVVMVQRMQRCSGRVLYAEHTHSEVKHSSIDQDKAPLLIEARKKRRENPCEYMYHYAIC